MDVLPITTFYAILAFECRAKDYQCMREAAMQYKLDNKFDNDLCKRNLNYRIDLKHSEQDLWKKSARNIYHAFFLMLDQKGRNVNYAWIRTSW